MNLLAITPFVTLRIGGPGSCWFQGSSILLSLETTQNYGFARCIRTSGHAISSNYFFQKVLCYGYLSLDPWWNCLCLSSQVGGCFLLLRRSGPTILLWANVSNHSKNTSMFPFLEGNNVGLSDELIVLKCLSVQCCYTSWTFGAVTAYLWSYCLVGRMIQSISLVVANH
jgi:hypothetical protein